MRDVTVGGRGGRKVGESTKSRHNVRCDLDFCGPISEVVFLFFEKMIYDRWPVKCVLKNVNDSDKRGTKSLGRS